MRLAPLRRAAALGSRTQISAVPRKQAEMHWRASKDYNAVGLSGTRGSIFPGRRGGPSWS
eukprot:7937831-Pyramimonas_sp.AAC.1